MTILHDVDPFEAFMDGLELYHRKDPEAILFGFPNEFTFLPIDPKWAWFEWVEDDET